MKPLKNVKSFWERSGDIVIRWDPAAIGNDRYISFYEVASSDTDGKLIPAQRIDLKMEENNSSITVKSSVYSSGVRKLRYVAFSHEEKNIGEDAVRNACSLHREYFIDVMVGHADIFYELQKKELSGSMAVALVFECSSPIESEMLGYRYNCGIQVLQSVPALPQGKTELPPIIVPKDTMIEIIPYRAEFSQNLQIQEKRKKLFGLF